jgi:hypothetical protein
METMKRMFQDNIGKSGSSRLSQKTKKGTSLPAENLAHAQDMVCEFHALHPNKPKPVGWGMRSRPGTGRQNTNAARIYVITAGASTLGY